MSRFFKRIDEDTLIQLEEFHPELRRRIYSIQQPEHILFDVDSTNFFFFFEQEGAGYNANYSTNGYHPLLVYDEFYYQTSSWSYPRRVIVKVEIPLNQFTYPYAFIIVNMDFILSILLLS